MVTNTQNSTKTIKKVAVWGTGNVGRPAIRAVAAHQGLELAAVIVSNPDKVGKDAGAIAGIQDLGVAATDDWQAVIKQGIDAVVYAANSDIRGEEAFMEVITVLSAGINVVSAGLYPLLYPKVGMKEAVDPVQAVCQQSGASVFISGIDPGWAMDLLPILISGLSADIEEIRCQEIFNYATYHQPQVIREIVGFGTPMDETPPMHDDHHLKIVWEPMVTMVANALGVELDSVETNVEKRALEKTIEVDGMGTFEKGTQGAFRFEVRGIVNGQARFVVEHVTRIDDDCAPDWPYPAEGQGCHKVIVKGSPELHVTAHGHDPIEPGPAGGGNGSAAVRIVNAIPYVCEADAGILSALDLPLMIHGGPQLRR